MHKDGDIKMQYWIDRRKKWVMQFLAVKYGKTLSEIAWDGASLLCLKAGLVDERTGAIKEELWPLIESVAMKIESEKRIRRSNKK